MTKFRLIVYYEDRRALIEIATIADKYNVQIHHDKEKRAVVLDIDSSVLLVNIARELYVTVE